MNQIKGTINGFDVHPECVIVSVRCPVGTVVQTTDAVVIVPEAELPALSSYNPPEFLQYGIMEIETSSAHNLVIKLLPAAASPIYLDHRFCWKKTAISWAERKIKSLGLRPVLAEVPDDGS